MTHKCCKIPLLLTCYVLYVVYQQNLVSMYIALVYLVVGSPFSDFFFNIFFLNKGKLRIIEITFTVNVLPKIADCCRMQMQLELIQGCHFALNFSGKFQKSGGGTSAQNSKD